MRWVIITGEYPPQIGGVADYTALLATALAATGDEIHIVAPACDDSTLQASERITVHRLPGRYNYRAINKLRDLLSELDRPRRLLVQYVPHSYGYKAMNLPFLLWLYSLRRTEEIWLTFHEVAVETSWDRPSVIGVANIAMAWLAGRCSNRIFVSCPAWRSRLGSMGVERSAIEWLPIPSTISGQPSNSGTHSARQTLLRSSEDMLIGHFGSFGPHVAPQLISLLPRLLSSDPRRRAVLVGRRSEAFAASIIRSYPYLAGQVVALGYLSPDDAANHLSACDLLVQPYVDGVSTRRTTVMAGLALGLPIITTRGHLTEAMWEDSQSVSLVGVKDGDGFVTRVEELLSNPEARRALAERGRRLYVTHFSMDRALAVLKGVEHDWRAA